MPDLHDPVQIISSEAGVLYSFFLMTLLALQILLCLTITGILEMMELKA
jgi:hypothetical protein